MFFISFPPEADLANGVTARVNGKETTVKLEDGCLVYDDQKCKIIKVDRRRKLNSYTCLSHGQDEATMIDVGLELE